MNLNIIVRYFEELEEEFKVFSTMGYSDFMLSKSIDSDLLRDIICHYIWYKDVSGDAYGVKHAIEHISEVYNGRNDTYVIEIIIEVLEKYYE